MVIVCSPGESGCAEDCGYIRLVTDDEPAVHVQPVTGSLLFGYLLRHVLGLPKLNWLNQGLMWNILTGLGFSCILVWWKTMSSGGKWPAVDQADAVPAAPDLLPGTFLGPGLDLTVQLRQCYSGCNGPSGYSAQCGHCESDVSSRQPLCQGGDT